VLVITTATGGTGLTLNEANTTIFYSNTWSSTDRIQAEDRNHRIGQDSKVTYHDLMVSQHIDHRIINVLKRKQERAMEFRSTLDVHKFLTEKIE
jgi:SNF2 family DNA or RNA helicase